MGPEESMTDEHMGWSWDAVGQTPREEAEETWSTGWAEPRAQGVRVPGDSAGAEPQWPLGDLLLGECDRAPAVKMVGGGSAGKNMCCH